VKRLGEYCIAWWNLENLFDVENSTERPDWLKKELKSELKGWNQTVLNKKISQLSKIISKINGGNGLDILGVCEVENKPVMNLLVNSLSSHGRAYKVAHHDTSDQRGIDVAFIYDSNKFTFERQFFHVILKRTATRDLFQVNFKLGNRMLILVGNHWPSRSAGTLYSEPYRILAAETLSYWHKRILEEQGEDVAIIFMGDFNDEPHSRSMTQYALSTNSKLKVSRTRSAPRIYNLMWPLMGKGLGTYYYDGFPYFFDQFSVSKGTIKTSSHIKVKPNSVKIERFPEMMQGLYKVPRRFGRPSAKKTYDEQGFSDHFPISLMLEAV
jgi:hypothetical protein